MIEKLDESQIEETRKYIVDKLPKGFVPKIAILSDVGMKNIMEYTKDTTELLFSEIPGFVQSTVLTKSPAKVVFGTISDTSVVILIGRCRFYEGYTLRQITYPVRVLKTLGIKIMIVLNASASLNPDIKIGDIGVIEDSISLPSISGINPLIGPNYSQMGPRFINMTDAYSFRLRKMLFKTWLSSPELQKRKMSLRECIYCFTPGPANETRAEYRAMRMLGGDVVGSSTIPEVEVARHCNLEVLCLSLVTTSATDEKLPSAYDAAKAEVEGRPPSLPVEEDHLMTPTGFTFSSAPSTRLKDMSLLLEKLIGEI